MRKQQIEMFKENYFPVICCSQDHEGDIYSFEIP
jgi:hypothetical protein